MVQIHSGLPFTWSYGALAQLGEHLLCKQGVIGSIPIGSTRQSARSGLPQGAKHTLQDEKKRDPASAGQAGLPPNFDIVNGFLNRCRGGIVARMTTFGSEFRTRSIPSQINQNDYLAEIISPHHREDEQALCRPVVDGVDSQA